MPEMWLLATPVQSKIAKLGDAIGWGTSAAHHEAALSELGS